MNPDQIAPFEEQSDGEQSDLSPVTGRKKVKKKNLDTCMKHQVFSKIKKLYQICCFLQWLLAFPSLLTLNAPSAFLVC